MFDYTVVMTSGAPPTTDDVRSWTIALRELRTLDDTDRVDVLRALEELKCAAAGAQARVSVDFAQSRCLAQEAAGTPSRQVGRGLAAQVALARRESPHQGQRLLGLAKALQEMQQTGSALSRGEITEWRATILARETGCLSREHRAAVDAELAARPGGLSAMGERELVKESRAIAYRLDPHAFVQRARRAESERSVSLRPAPDTMSFLTGLLPVRQGVAVFAALTHHADSLRSQGDGRSRGQIMADALVERVTGVAAAADIPVEVRVVMPHTSLLGDGSDPATVEGYGPVPAALARTWLRHSGAAVWIRRLYTAPDADRLVAMDTTRRTFTGLLRQFIILRDELCRTPWCGAPIRHIDHPRRAADGGPTSAANSQGLCAACNLAKEADGWTSAPCVDGTVETTTPTGHRYLSPVPRGPAARGPTRRPRVDINYRNLDLTA